MRVPLLDLKAQYPTIRADAERALAEVFADQHFVLGPAVHRFENDGDADATSLAVVTPGILGPGYFRELGALLSAAAGGPPDRDAFAAIMRRHGLTPT